MQDRADQLRQEVDEVNEQAFIVSKLSNLSLQLYSWYIKNGHARNEKDEEALKEFFESSLLPRRCKNAKGFYERLYLYQSYCWYAFIRQDFLQYYRYTQKWVDLFDEQPQMIEIETAHYIKGMHNLMGAHFNLLNHQKFRKLLSSLKNFS